MEQKLKKQRFLRDNFFIDKELQAYDTEVKPFAHLVQKFTATFPKLSSYIFLMDYLIK